MSTLDIAANRMESFSDWMNPILVKETRQALKSRQFVATFMLLLIACWMICLFGVISQGSQIEYGSPSAGFLQGFHFVLSVATIIVIPFTSFRSLLSEQDAQTFELLSITSLSPRQIVWGKLLNSVLQIFVFYCAIAPFVAFTSLLQGFDLVRTAIVLTTLFGASVLLCMFTLMLSTVARSRQIQTLSSLIIFGGLMGSFSTITSFSIGIGSGLFDLNTEFYTGLACVWLVGISYFVLFLQITISQLMFDAANRSTGIRIVAQAQFLLFWLIPLVYSWFTSSSIDRDLLEMMTICSIIHWAVFGFFISMERDYLSRRVRRELPRSGLLRLISVPYMPGGARGYLLILINLAALLLILSVTSAFWTTSSYGSNFPTGARIVILYCVFYLGLGCWITRQLVRLSNELQPMHGRTILIVLLAFGAIVPYVLLWLMGHFETYNPQYSLLLITNPLVTLMELDSGSGMGSAIIGTLALLVLVAVSLNVFAILRGIAQILAPKRAEAR